MLVLSRRVGERIVVPGLDVELTVIAVEGGRVRLGIAAPHQVSVRRQEQAPRPRRVELPPSAASESL